MRRLAICLFILSPIPAFTGSVAALQATPGATPTAQIMNEAPGHVPVSMLIRNLGSRDDVLLGASSPIAEGVVLHHSQLVAGIRMMEPLDGGVMLPAGSTTIFEPESDHLMLIGTWEALVQGDRFPLVLHFQRAGTVNVTGRVRRKVDAAGITPIPPVVAGDIEISLVSAPPAPAAP